jgi:peptidoglycan/LPS O-acetylase OafA/YrhL
MFAVHGSFAYAQKSVQAVGYTMVGIASASLLVMAVTAGRRRPVGVLFNSAWLRFLGKYSYGIYVFHGLVAVGLAEAIPLRRLLPKVGNSVVAGCAVQVVAGSLISIGIALASWHLYEKHFLKLKRFFEYRTPTLEGFKANEPVRNKSRMEDGG